MARIPVYQERQQVNQLLNVPQLNVPSAGAGAIGQSMQQMGQALSQVANAAVQAENRQAQIWSTETSTNELVYWAQRSEELKANAPKGGAGFVQTVNQEFEERANALLAQAPSDASRRYLAQNFLNLRKNLLSNAIQFEAVEGRAALVQEFSNGADKIALAAAQTMDPQLAQEAVGQLKAQIDNSNLLPRQKEEIKQRLESTVAIAYAGAVVQNNPSAAVDILSQGVPTVKGDKNLTNLFAAIQSVESSNNPKAVGPMTRRGEKAIGFMQVLPSTAMDPGFGLPNVFDFAKSKGVTVSGRTEADAQALLMDEKIGAEYGQAYMKAMLNRYDDNVVYALAAYNWGPGNADNWISRGANMDELPRETRNYIPNVLNRAGLTGVSAGAPADSMFAMLPLGEQLKMLDTARANQSAQVVEFMARAVFDEFGPKTDTDPIELDLLNDHIDVLMADRTVDERKTAKQLLKSYAEAHNASARQREAERVSNIWTSVMNGQSMEQIQSTPEWRALDGTQQKKLITEIGSFRSQPTSPDQWALYAEIKSDPAKFAAMSTEQVLALAPLLGNELTTKLIQDRAALNTPQDIAKAEYDEDTFKIFAAKAGIKVFDKARRPADKENEGKLRYAIENLLVVRANELRRPLNRAEQEDVMAEVIGNKVYLDRWGRDPEFISALVAEDEFEGKYVMVGSRQVFLSKIPDNDREMIIKQLRAAGEPVSEAAIAEIWVARQTAPDPRFEMIPR
jgi:soluble lytic murein transglycosylase-like protein